MEERALTEDVMDRRKVMAIREDLRSRRTRTGSSHTSSRSFLSKPFRNLRAGTIRKREHDRYEITSVPYDSQP